MSHNSWRLRCSLCNKEFIGTLSKVVNHHTQPSGNARCPHTTGEILSVIRSKHPKVKLFPALMTKLNECYALQGRPADAEDPQDLALGDEAGALGEPGTSSAGGDSGRDTGSTGGQGSGVGYDSTSVQRRERADFVAYTAAPDSRGPDLPSEIADHLRGPVLAAARPPRPPSSVQQSSMTSYVVDELQKEFDQGVASFFFENAIAFNVARSDSYKNLERHEPGSAQAVIGKITTFIKRHQRALAMFRKSGREYRTQMNIKEGRSLELIQSRETRFGTNFLMLQRLRECEGVLLLTFSYPWCDDTPWDRTTTTRARSCKELIRDTGWWLTVDRACTLLEPVYALMKNMDRDGRMGMQVWSLGITLEKRMVVLPMDHETRQFVMAKVKDRVQMMALPVHAAAWMLHPLHRSPLLFDDLDSEEIANTLTRFASVHPKNSKEYKECWNSLKSFHHMDPEWIGKNSEEALTGDHVSMAQWWLTYGKRHPALMEIAVKVLSMWTTASPCKRNWSTFDLVHSKRRNLLSPENLEMLVFIHWNKKLLRMSKAKMGFVNTEQLEWETPEDDAPFDGFMQDGSTTPQRSKSTRFDVREIQEERLDDGAWLLDVSYGPRRLAVDDRGKTAAAVDEEEDDRDDNDCDDELLEVRLTDKRLSRRSGGGSCSATDVDITPLVGPASGGPSTVALVSLMGDAGAGTRLRSCAAGGVASVQGTSTVLGAQHTPHQRAAVEELCTGCGATCGGSTDVDEDSAAAGDVGDFGVSVDVLIPGAAEHEDGDTGADKDDPVPGATEDTHCTGGDVFSTPDPGLLLADRFASLLQHVAPIAARGSKTDFQKHLAAMSPMRSDSEGQTPDWARFTGPTPPTLQLSEDTPIQAGDGS
ncbi:hypothetical protein CBR_g10778 [Chara braunii]|uniref:HAT C-terminal dimerisation domain-containing protein n=1 Tax=Chara braunii TaxID=69332 RepID=A0A388KP58_CHABU|nr:hypothetical protein CBR_g10778 [Chara braunii]|eukprot:GBG71839.1 hypothetical protein CBR_g10778 [Chara braunii]